MFLLIDEETGLPCAVIDSDDDQKTFHIKLTAPCFDPLENQFFLDDRYHYSFDNTDNAIHKVDGLRLDEVKVLYHNAFTLYDENFDNDVVDTYTMQNLNDKMYYLFSRTYHQTLTSSSDLEFHNEKYSTLEEALPDMNEIHYRFLNL